MLTIAEATVTLTAPSSPPCFGQTYKLTCTHPVLDADTNVRWERNGTGFNPQSTPNHDGDGPTPTTTTLTINVTREEFENIVYNYRCLTLNTSTDTVVRIYSNNVTVNPLGKNLIHHVHCIHVNTCMCNIVWDNYILRIILSASKCTFVLFTDIPHSVLDVTYSKTNDSISLNWQHEDVCFGPISYEIEVQNDVKTVLTVNTTNPNITIKGLVPKTKYPIAIRAVSGTVRSEPYLLMITTLGWCIRTCVYVSIVVLK